MIPYTREKTNSHHPKSQNSAATKQKMSASSSSDEEADNQCERSEESEENEEDNGNNSSDDDSEDEENLPLSVRLQLQQDRAEHQAERGKKTTMKTKREDAASNNTATAPFSKRQRTTSSSSKKHAPTEVSSKRADFYQRGPPQLDNSGIGIQVLAHRYQPRDPRLQPLPTTSSSIFASSGKAGSEEQYEFLHEMRLKEIADLQRRVSAWKQAGRKGQKLRQKLGLTFNDYGSTASKERDQAELQRLLQELAHFDRLKMERRAQEKVKEMINQKRNPLTSAQQQQQQKQQPSSLPFQNMKKYYPKRSELKQLHWKAKVELLNGTTRGAADEAAGVVAGNSSNYDDKKKNAKNNNYATVTNNNSNNNSKAVEKLIVQRRKRLKSKHAKYLK